MLQVYQQIGEAGCALAVLALYLALKNLTLLTLIGRDFRRRFALIESGQKPYSEELHNPGNPLIGIIAAVVETHATHSNDLRAEVAYLFHRNFAAPVFLIFNQEGVHLQEPLFFTKGWCTKNYFIFHGAKQHSLVMCFPIPSVASLLRLCDQAGKECHHQIRN